MKPILYAANATTFTSNGLGALADAISCSVTEERNGEYTMQMVYPVDGLHYSDITLSSLIKCELDAGRGGQMFRVYKITRPLNGQVTIEANHLSYQLSHIPCAPFTAGSANAALAGLASNAAEACPFSFTTDKDTVATYTQTAPASIRSRLGGVQGSILDCYGGEYEFDNYVVHLWDSRGQDRGVTLRYGKNLTDLTQEANIADTITGVYPFYQDDNNYVQLPEKTISAESAANYPFPRTIALDCTDQFDDAPTVAQLRAYAQSYISKAGIGVPKVNVKVAFVNLRDTEEYKDVAALETVELCDTVTVIYEKLGVNATAKIIKTTWDVLAERYESVEIGEAKSSLAETIATAKEEARDAVTGSALTQAIARATDLITGVTGGYIRFNRNADGQPYEMLIMDHETIETSTNIWRYNSAGWGFSHDGGANYTTAATIDGGIIADSIVAGTLTGLEIDNGSGTFHVDSAGNVTANSLNSSNATITGGKINIQTSSDTADYITLNSSRASASMQTSGLYVTNKSTAANPNRRSVVNGAAIVIKNTSTDTPMITLNATGSTGNIYATGNISADKVTASTQVSSIAFRAESALTTGYSALSTGGLYLFNSSGSITAMINQSDGTITGSSYKTLSSGNSYTGRTATITISGTTLRFVNGLLVS